MQKPKLCQSHRKHIRADSNWSGFSLCLYFHGISKSLLHSALFWPLVIALLRPKQKTLAKTVQSQPVCLSFAGRATLRRFVSVFAAGFVFLLFVVSPAYNLLI